MDQFLVLLKEEAEFLEVLFQDFLVSGARTHLNEAEVKILHSCVEFQSLEQQGEVTTRQLIP